MADAASGLGLSAEQTHALALVLDAIVPPSGDGRLPGAGQLGLVDFIARRAPDLAPVITQGLAGLDAIAADRGVEGFAALDAEQRTEALNELAASQPGFLPGLVFQTYAGYYQSPAVLEALGMEPRPPFPQGYALETGDLTLLDAVRDGPRRYREAG